MNFKNRDNGIFSFRFSGLNFQDLMVRQGAIDSPPKCPFILGFECAGEIEQVGEGVEGFSVSDPYQFYANQNDLLVVGNSQNSFAPSNYYFLCF
jgi:NADPH:quinone reductase-like Zn-dependent oxidoreductase